MRLVVSVGTRGRHVGPGDPDAEPQLPGDPGNGATDPDIYYAGQGIILQDNIYQGLLQYKGGTATPTIIPDLATSYMESKNYTVYTLKLRHGVYFHDGTPFTSAAVAPSFARRLAWARAPPTW